MKLHEITSTNEFFFKDRESISSWIEDTWHVAYSCFDITDDLTVNFYPIGGWGIQVDEHGLKNKKLPFKIGRLEDGINLRCDLESLIGFPSWVQDSLQFRWNHKFRWEDFPECEIYGHLSVHGHVKSLKGISTNIKAIGQSLGMDLRHVKEGCLEIFNIEQPPKSVRDIYGFHINEPWIIINKYLQIPNSIFDCQAELIENGFEEFAKL